MDNRVEELNKKFESSSPQDILEYFLTKYKGKIVQSSSLGAEDQVITDMITRINNKTGIFTLDTGRLFPETYELIEKTNKHYNISIKVYFPDWQKVEKMISEKGINLFYRSVDNRKLCCHVRKIEPAKRALKGYEAWISGIRKDQTVSRFDTKTIEWDDTNRMIKINPLLKWTEKQVWDYIKKNNVPFNELHNSGFSSIGCQPCTRAIQTGDEFRAGRWWWEEPEQKECGLHDRSKNNS